MNADNFVIQNVYPCVVNVMCRIGDSEGGTMNKKIGIMLQANTKQEKR